MNTSNPAPQEKSKRRLQVLIASGLLVLLLVLLWDWNWLKPLVEWKASSSLGRKVTLGHFDIKLSKQPLVVMDHLLIANPPEFPAESAFASATQLSVRIDPSEIFDGRIGLPEIVLSAPQAALQPGPSGKPNYIFEALQDKSGSSGPSVEIGQLKISDGDVHFIDPELKSDFHLKIRTEDGTDNSDNRIRVDIAGSYANQAIIGRFTGGSVLSLRDTAHPYPVDLQVRHGATTVTLLGTIERPLNFAGAQLKLDFGGDNLANLYPLTGVPLPPTSAYKLTGGLGISRTGVEFQHFSGTVGDSDLSGDLAIDLSAKPRRKITAHVVSKKLVLKDLGIALGAPPDQADAKAKADEKKKATGKVLPDVAINLPRIRAADLDVNYKATRLESSSIPLDDLELHVLINDGQLRLAPMRFGVGSGSINGDIMLDGRQDQVHAVADVEFRKLDVSHILKKMTAFQGDGKIGGLVRIDSKGNSVADMLGNGNGEMKLFMAGGQLSGLLVNLMGLDLGNSLRSALGLPRRAELRCMLADFSMKQGLMDTRTMLVDTTEANIIGSGNINLRDEQLDYVLKTEPKHINIGSIAAPIHIKGALGDPKISLDATSLTARGASALVLGALLTPIAALIPTIQLGLGDDNDCVALLKGVKPPKPN